jgi:hypothetical protein
VGVLYGRNGEMRGEWGKCDLKNRSRTAQLEYVRSHIGAVDRTRAWRRWCNGLCVRTYRVSSTASVPECVRVLGVLRSNSPRRGRTQRPACGRTYISTFERRDPK